MIDKKWLKKNKGKVICTSISFLLGFVYLVVGFWKMLFFALIIGIGFVIGHNLDRKTDVKELLDSILLDKWMRK